jgi:hypothetical protein
MPPAIKETSQWFVGLPCYNATNIKSNIQKLADEKIIQLKQEDEVVYFRKIKNFPKNFGPKINHHLGQDSDDLAEIKKEINDLRSEINDIKQRLAQKDAQIIKLTMIIRSESIRKET